MVILSLYMFFYRIRRYRLQLLPLHDMDGSDIDSEEDEEEREEENSSEREPAFTVSIKSSCALDVMGHWAIGGHWGDRGTLGR